MPTNNLNPVASRSLPGKLVTLSLALALTAAPLGLTHAKDDVPEVSHDGLHLLPDSKAAIAYVNPEADFGIYDKLMLLDCYVAFKKNWQRDVNRDIRSVGSKVRDSDMEKIKTGVAELFREVFIEELDEKGGYDVVDTAGESVLLIRPAIIDLEVTAPDTNTAGRSYTFVNSAGAATLYIELYDSVTGDILARAIDRKAGRDYGRMQWSTSVANSAEARRMMRRWAGWLREGLDEVHGKSD